MEDQDFDAVLNFWDIYEENERLSLKSLFFQTIDRQYANKARFSEFIATYLGKEPPEGPLP